MDRPPRKLMRRREFEDGWESVRFITFSCERRLPLLSNPKTAQVFADALQAARARFHFALYAWVVMPEHVHLLLKPPEDTPLARILLFMKLRTAQRIINRWRELQAPILATITHANTPRFWQKGGGFDRNVRDEPEFGREVRYIHRNPVERGLVERPEDYRDSSIRWWMGRRANELECDPPPGKGWDNWKGYR